MGLGLPKTLAFTALVAFVLPLVLGTVSLRVAGIAFAMVTLAFAEAGRSSSTRTRTAGPAGGEVSRSSSEAAEAFMGVLNAKNCTGSRSRISSSYS